MASYTKEKLKTILINHNVAIPKDAKKDVYLDLYRTHVESMNKSEFSSDDEVSISRSPTKRNKKKPGLPKKKTIEEPTMNGTVDISSLTDVELREKLKSNGVNAGPITDSTRRLYEKKLQRLLEASVHSEAVTAKPAPAPKPAPARRPEPVPARRPEPVRYVPPPAPPAEAEFSDPDDEEEEEEETPEPEPEPEPRQTALRRRPAAPVRMSPRRPTPVKKYEAAPRPAPYRQPEPQQVDDEEEEEDEDVNDGTLHSSIRPYRNGPSVVPSSARQTNISTPTPTARTVPAAAPPATSGAPRPRRLAIWMQVLLFIFVAVVIYFVIQNIEPASGKSYIGKLPG